MFRKAQSSTLFYGWFVVAACFAVTLTIGETFWSFGVFFKPLENNFGWSRALISSAYTVFLIGYGISLVVSGRVVDRYNPRIILLITAVLSGLGIALCSQVYNIHQFRGFFFIAGLGAGATWSVPTATVQRWFHGRPRAGLALGIVVSGVGAGALIFAPLINHFIFSYGWRNAYLIVGILFFIIIVIAALVIRPSPTKLNLASQIDKKPTESASANNWTTRKALTNRTFVAMTFALCLAIFAFQALSVHIVPYATDVGISPTASAAALGLIGGFSIPGRIISGIISDKIGWQRTLALALFSISLSIIWLLFLKETWMLYCFVFFYGISHGIRVPAGVGIITGFFGLRSLGELIGISTAIAQFFGALAPYIAGSIFDRTGSYFTALLIMMALLFCGGIVAMIMHKPPDRIASGPISRLFRGH